MDLQTRQREFKGFNDLGEAIAYMRRGPIGSGVEAEGGKSGAGSGSLLGRYVEGGDFVKGTQDGDIMIAEDMEVYLVRVCTKLRVGCPLFEFRKSYLCGGVHTVAYSASLQCPEKGVELEVHDSFFMDEQQAQQDACFRLLQQLLSTKGKTIMDFNHRLLAVAR
ncbi:hypothetical protein PIB30_030976 [Stylosanthes scabra]|uniref:Uncharacterized protein n=1 Tax=Stylosanthes scabra TaxID=79078 RepID=A0ABU6TCI6_9FABA|nr:hypothetical protein [Stylosanthes scabra]